MGNTKKVKNYNGFFTISEYFLGNFLFVLLFFLNFNMVLLLFSIGRLKLILSINSVFKIFNAFLLCNSSSSTFDFKGIKYPFILTSGIAYSSKTGRLVTARAVTISNLSRLHLA